MKKKPVFSKWISRLSHPVITFPLALVLLFGNWNEWIGLTATILLAFGLPFLYFLYLWKAKKVTDFDISKREQRYPVYVASLIGMILALCYSYIYSPSEVFLEFLKLVVLAAVIMIVNFKVKVSIHTAMVFVLCVFLVSFYQLSAWVFLLVPIVALSRLQLRRHSLVEVFLGILLPAILYLIW